MFSHEYFFKNILNTDVISDKIITYFVESTKIKK